MSYQIVIQSAAQRQLKKLTPEVQKALIAVIENLAIDPRPAGCKKLKGRADEYRLRWGNYRIIYQVEDRALIIRVIKVGHRRDIYEG
ncbi:type II toxin-antitoxin system RelE/ParE family toxin [Spirulina major CS-329]|uniref:type II toxin-antitoxin system RelE family toxin n=1 Tax=Spirulina TaxID=1154 RepID=UPI00232EFC1F|nr:MULTISPECIES: type II toxin-antitoxin system RelE/ParE family toxin [Spirulina]MDB9493892.1 type II toxin-antitoxin system RelE/ParE family toxin [Spirulina subsalsa CS-330]MDB9504576.1 type II toxin-antitoxin system RelE/ParE family toxin [Spirulina major CS-329]